MNPADRSTLTQLALPSIAAFVPVTATHFVMPKPGGDDGRLTALLAERLMGTDMTLRKLELEPHDCIPVHVHQKRSKLYHQQCGSIKVFLWQRDWSEKPDEFIVNGDAHEEESGFFVIPAGQPHAVLYCSGHEFDGACETHIISTPDDPADIAWEESAIKLCENTQEYLG